MRIFPKNISENTWKEHLSTYSHTLVHFSDEVFRIIAKEHHAKSIYNIYLCPLCLRNYYIGTAIGVVGNSEFSLDHLPPKSAGGTYKIITCKKCNNDSGAFESELEKTLNFAIDKTNLNRLVIPNIRVRDIETGESIKGYLISENNRTEILFSDYLKKYKKNYIDFLAKVHSDQNKKLKLEVPLFDTQKMERALMKSAYLICFFWWGYEFAFSENGKFIREVIKGKRKYPCQVPISWGQEGNDYPSGISILQNDKGDRKAFLVNINLKGINVKSTANILIPSPTKEGWKNIEYLNEIAQSDKITEYNCVTIPRIVHRIGYSVSWNIIFPVNSK